MRLTLLLILISILGHGQQPEIFRQTMHQNTISAVAFTPDGKYIVSGSEDKTLKIWDRATGYQVDIVKVDQFIRQLEFTPDGKRLIIGTSKKMMMMTMYLEGEGDVIIMDFATRNQLKNFHYSSFPVSICCSKNGQYAFVAYNKGYDIINLETLSSLTNLPVTISPVDIAVSPDLTMMAAIGVGESRMNELVVFKLNNMTKIKPYFKEKMVVFSAVAFSPDNNYLACGDEGGKVRVLDTKKFKEVSNFKFEYSDRHWASVRQIKYTHDGKFIITSSGDEKIKIWDAVNGKLVRTFSGHKKPITDFDLSPDSEYILSSAVENDFKYWEISSGTIDNAFNFQSPIVNALDISKDKKYFVTAADDGKLRLFDYKDDKLLRVLTGHNYKIKFVTFSPDSRYILSAAADEVNNNYVGEAILWDATNGKMIKHFPCESSVSSICFSPDSKKFIVSESKSFIYDIKSDQKQFVWELTGYSPISANIFWLNDINKIIVANSASNENLRLTIQSLKVRDTKEVLTGGGSGTFSNSTMSPDAKYFATQGWGPNIDIWDISKKTTIKTIYCESSYAFTFSNDSKYLASCDYTGITIWDVLQNKIIKHVPSTFGYVNAIKFSPDDKFILIGVSDGTVRKLNILNNEWIALIGDNTGEQWIVYNNEGYWDASTQVGNFITMKLGSQIFGIDQMAVWTNRPDKIYKKFGETDQQTLAHFQKQYLKRLRKMGLSEKDSSFQFEIPKVEITETNLLGKILSITLNFSKNSSKIASYNIFINDIPVFGALGKPFNESNASIVEQVELTEGKNKIEVSCTNVNGVESYRALTLARYNETTSKNLYLLAFGVSKYQNSTLNLKYAHKDALDLEKVMQGLKGKGFENVYTKVLTNEQVTPDAIKAAKDFVKNAKPDDTFILFIAGHGMHDKDAEATYYYLTSNADVNKLKATAADFETIEDLLQGIPPRNKLFLMDACESGEIDEEDQGQMIAAATGVGIASRGFKTATRDKVQVTSGKRTYLYQKDRYIFNDLVRRSGAIVFSSSKGGELSYERSDIENGLFTEYIMKALTTTEADKDINGIVSTDELRQYVSEQVAKASGDLQHPTVDRDNIYQKFGFQIK